MERRIRVRPVPGGGEITSRIGEVVGIVVDWGRVIVVGDKLFPEIIGRVGNSRLCPWRGKNCRSEIELRNCIRGLQIRVGGPKV